MSPLPKYFDGIRLPRYVFFLSLGCLMLFSGVHVGLILLLYRLGCSDIVLVHLVLLYWVLVAVGLTKYIQWYTRRFYEKPIRRIAEAAGKVAGGDFSVRLDCTSKIRDVREVYGSFNTMVKELGNTETLQTDFVSNVSHEFKTPINAIEGYASLLQDSQLTDEQKNTYIDKIIFNTRRLSDLVGNILLLSKVNNQTISLKASTFRLDEQVRQSILALESKWEKKEIEFDIDLDEIEYTGYENLLSHVWLNLIDNAVKFSPQNGQIRIRLKQLDGSVTFSIWDNGLPIPEADIDRIFNKFYQGDNSHASEGNGLGLALVRKIVAAAHGTINVTSSEDAGTEFVVALPNSSSDS